MPIFESETPRWWWLVPIGLLALPLAVYTYLGTFSRYLADEYCYANVSNTYGFWNSQAHWYLTWSGRIGANALITLGTLTGPSVTAWLPGILLISWALGLSLSLSLLPMGVSRISRYGAGAVLALALMFAVLSSLNNLPQVLYWETASLTYVVPVVVVSWTPWVSSRVVALSAQSPRLSILAPAVVIAAMAFVGAGFSEVWAVVQIVGYAAACAGVIWLNASGLVRRRIIFWVFAGLLGSVAMLGLNVFAPGTGVRQSGFLAAPPVLDVQHNAQLYARWYLRDIWTASPEAPLGLLCVAILVTWGFAAGPVARWMNTRRLIGIILISTAALYLFLTVAYAPVYYMLRFLPPPRVLLNPGVIWAMTFAGAGGCIGLWIKRELWLRSIPVASAGVAVALGLTTTLWIVPITMRTLQETPVFRAYAAAWDAYDRLLRNPVTHQSGEASLFQLTYPAESDMLGTNPDHWLNQCVRVYYGLSKIVAEPAPSAVSVTETIPLDSSPVADRFGSVVELNGYALTTRALHPGDLLRVRFYWTPLALSQRPYTHFVHLINPTRGSIAQSDSIPLAGAYSTDRWLVGYPFSEEVVFPIPGDAVPGSDLFLVVGWYDLTTMERLPVVGAEADEEQSWVRIGQLSITAP